MIRFLLASHQTRTGRPPDSGISHQYSNMKTYSAYWKALGVSCILVGCAACNRHEAAPAPAEFRSPVPPLGRTPAKASPGEFTFEIPPAPAVPVYSRDVAPLIEKYCLDCHNSVAAKGGVVLDNFRDEVPDKEQTSLLQGVAGILRSESMPPEGEPRPDSDELETINCWLDAAIATDRPDRRGVALRRLNRVAFNNTIRDLIGLELRPADDFPSDDVGYGFDNIAEVLSMPPVLVEMYLAAAERTIREALRNPESRARILNPPVDAVPLAFRKFKPPVRTPRADKIFRTTPVTEDPEFKRQQHIYDILRAFADRAFRRPATHDELTRLLGTVLSAEKDGESPESSLELALEAVLASPQFLFGSAAVDDPGQAGPPLPPNDYALASRLSYFLWSSMPDDELFRLASQGTLRQPETLRAQVLRMLQDRKGRSLAENFAPQWLELRKLGEFAPDPVLFPDFDEALRSAMLEETRRFFATIQDEDRDVRELLDADFTFLNDRLARHYGIAGVVGSQFRRVTLSGTPRGGVLTQASVLTATSNPTRTSPVKRGKWILENILGTPPAPPPSGVEALKEAQGSVHSATLRDRMESHRSNPSCASCHRRMDPLGFAIENFDAIGAWRTHDGDQTIDPTGKFPGGQPFHGPIELKAILLSRRHAFARCLSEKMLTYALARGLERADRRHVDQIADRLARDGYRFSALVLAIVESAPFREPENAGGAQ
jgi:hypothetical protein